MIGGGEFAPMHSREEVINLQNILQLQKLAVTASASALLFSTQSNSCQNG
jgi:hypothetical protein